MERREVRFDVVEVDYKQTNDLIKLLTDIRFKLLALVPPLVGVGVGLISTKSFAEAGAFQAIGLGLLGFLVTLGIVLYDLRNSQLYDALVHRAKVLESVMGCVLDGKEKIVFDPNRIPERNWTGLTGGPHTQRPSSFLQFVTLDVGHGPALALIYGVLLAAWFYPIVKGLGVSIGHVIREFFKARLPEILQTGSGYTTSLVAFVVAAIACRCFYNRLVDADLPAVVTYLGYGGPQPEPGWKSSFEDEARERHQRRAEKRWRLPAWAMKVPKAIVNSVASLSAWLRKLVAGVERRQDLDRLTNGQKIDRTGLKDALNNVASGNTIQLDDGTFHLLGTIKAVCGHCRILVISDRNNEGVSCSTLVAILRVSQAWEIHAVKGTNASLDQIAQDAPNDDAVKCMLVGRLTPACWLNESEEHALIARGWC